MARGRAYMRPDEDAALYRVKLAHPRRPNEVRIIGPYATIGPARGQASEFKRSGYTVEVQVARPTWEPVDGGPPTAWPTADGTDPFGTPPVVPAV